jgi:hypothetical protein
MPLAGLHPRFLAGISSVLALAVLALAPAAARPGPEDASLPSRSDTVAAPGENSSDLAIVFLDRELFRLRAAIAPFSIGERAAAIERRIAEAVTELPADRTFEVATEDLGAYARISAGERVLVVVSELDARPAGLTPIQLARLWSTAIAEGVRDARARALTRRDPQALWWALLATTTLIATGVLVHRVGRRLFRRIERTTLLRSGELGLEEAALDPVRRLNRALWGLVGITELALTVALGIAWLQFVLGLFPATRRAAITLRSWSLAPLRAIAESAMAYLPKLLFLLAIGLVTVGVLRLLDWL